MIIVWIICSIYFLQLALLVLMLLNNQSKNFKVNQKSVSVIVPFHNEEERILHLIESINNQNYFENIELIFVDDYSSDNTRVIIAENLRKPAQVLINTTKRGKKSAINFGIQNAKHPVILTLDADCYFNQNYFSSIAELPEADMIILPVQMIGKTMFQSLASIEFKWLQLLTFGSRRPILNNGANLLFNKQSYCDVQPERSDFEIPSGDDYFLLNAFKKSNRKILRCNQNNLRVTTLSPENMKQLIEQRRRWITKTKYQFNAGFVTYGFMLGLAQFGLLFSLVCLKESSWFLLPIFCKILVELVVINIGLTDNRFKQLFVVVLHQLWYPYYLFSLVFRPHKPEPKWNFTK